jgi:Tetratricopeptide repeat
MRIPDIMKRGLLLTVIGVIAIFVAPLAARAQCATATLSYIVRDEKGRVIEPTKQDGWGLNDGDFVKNSMGENWMHVPENIVTLAGKSKVLQRDATCNFRSPLVTLNLSRDGKTMKLMFVVSRREGATYLADSLPFQPGTFKIEMERSGFYPADGWKKITEAEELFTEGEAALWDGEYETAITYLKRAASQKPDNAKTFRYLGYSYLETKQYVDAVAALKQSTRLNPNSAVAYSLLGRAHWLTDQNKETIEACEQALRLAPTDKEWTGDLDDETRDRLKKAQIALESQTQPTKRP